MPSIRNHITALSILACLTLSGCAMKPAETWTNRGPSEIVPEKGKYVCYTDAQIIDGSRTLFNLCATPESGFFGDGEPEIWAGTGIRMPFKFPLSEAIKGTMVPIDDKNGLVKCDPLKSDASKEEGLETFCKLTLNEQVLVSARIVFESSIRALMK